MTAKEEFLKSNGPCYTTAEWEKLAHSAEYNLARMVALSGMSHRHMQRLFKRYFHCTPTRWLRELRCREAQGLILQGYSSKCAASELKYATNAHFCREFKKVFGVSPQHFAPGNRTSEQNVPARQRQRAR